MPKTFGLRLVIAAAASFAAVFFYLSIFSDNAKGAGDSSDLSALDFSILPQTPVSGCRGGSAKLYDECGSQVEIFKQALNVAKAEDKKLLVSFGAEWCIWCHVFDAYIEGEHTDFTHTYAYPSDEERFTSTLYERAQNDPRAAARALAEYVSDTFVLVHIESRYSNDGFEVLEMAKAEQAYSGSLPFIFSVNNDGQFASSFNSQLAMTRRDADDWFRGYNRDLLRQELERLNARASAP